MKKFLLLMVAGLACGLPVSAADGDEFTVDNFKYEVVSEEEHRVAVAGYVDEPSGEIAIPSKVEFSGTEYNVTNIGFSAFMGCANITSVSLTETVTLIADFAFERCTSLTSFTIPSSVTYVGWAAIRGCFSLEEIIVDEGNANYSSQDGCLFNKEKTTIVQCPGGKESYTLPSSVTTIGPQAFYECVKLTTVTIPNSVTKIDNLAFYYCSSLSSVTLPESVTYLGKQAFEGCSSLTTADIKATITEIPQSTFLGCSALTSVNIPDGVTHMGYGVFAHCSSLASIDLPETLTKIEGGTFYKCISLKSVTIPNGVTEIDYNTFAVCSGLTTVNIPETVLIIGEKAFEYCQNLTEIAIPKSVQEIGSRSFASCGSLIEIYSYAANPPALESEAFTSVPADAVVYVPGGTLDAYSQSAWTAYFSDFREMGSSAIDEVGVDNVEAPADYFNLNGVNVGSDTLTPGLYIKKQGGKVSKVLVK